MSAANFHQNAASFALGAHKLLNAEADVPDELKPSFYLLAGFALELGLKSMALAADVDPQVVRDWGHDLPKAYDGVVGTGLLPRHELDLTALMRALDLGHKRFHYRYTPEGVGVVEVPPAGWTVRVLFSLIELSSKVVFRTND